MKPQNKIGIVGHVGHGKTSLFHAIIHYVSNCERDVDFRKNENDNFDHKSFDKFQYETSEKHYLYFDSPGHDYEVQKMVLNANNLNGIILVVSAADGLMPQTHEYIKLAKQFGISSIVVFLNKIDIIEDSKLQDLIVDEIRGFLSECGFAGDEIPIIKGSALLYLEGRYSEVCSIKELIKAINS